MYKHKDTFVKMHTHTYWHICTQRQRELCAYIHVQTDAQMSTGAHTCTGLCSFIHVLRHKGIHVHTQSHLQDIQLYT